MSTATTVESRCDKSIAILKLTNDGADLAPKHLYLLQEYVNGGLTEYGEELFNELYKGVVIDKTYDKTKVYYYNVEHMTRDHDGYIYFKGKHVEHYSYPSNRSEEEKADLKTLQRICLMLEAKGVEVNVISAVWHREKYITEAEMKTIKETAL